MQVVLGTITDAILQKHPGPMNAGSGRMIGALTNILLGYLGLESGARWAGDEADLKMILAIFAILDRKRRQSWRMAKSRYSIPTCVPIWANGVAYAKRDEAVAKA